MPGVMADKGQLGEDERQQRSHNELPSAVAKPKESRACLAALWVKR
jgi:hypothetical protein